MAATTSCNRDGRVFLAAGVANAVRESSLTQVQIARLIDVPRGTLVAWLLRVNPVQRTDRRLKRLARVLRLAEGELFDCDEREGVGGDDAS